MKTDKAYGQLVVQDLPQDLCYKTPAKFIKDLTKYLTVELAVNSNVDFVVIGPQVPSEDDKSRLWIKLYANGTFAGLYLFEGGSWTQVQNRRVDEIVWFHGDSRSIPEGYQLIDNDAGTINSTVRDHIMSFYLRDTEVSTTTTPVYTYFACIYIGTTIS